MQALIERLHDGNYSCVIANNEIRTFTQRGVADLFHLLHHEPDFLQGALVADKVVGKAAAALLVLGRIQAIHADVISEPALRLLQNAQIKVYYGKTVSFILNRDQSGWCPLEKLCYSATTAEEILPLIRTFLLKMSAQKAEKQQ
jgi:hypothetical protein